jgi:Sulfate permease family
MSKKQPAQGLHYLRQPNMNAAAVASADPTVEVCLVAFDDRVHGGSEIAEEMIEQERNPAPEKAKKQDQQQQHDDDESNFPVEDVTCWSRAAKSWSSPRQAVAHTSGQEWFQSNKPQITSGIVVALASIPEIISFSFIAGVNPIVGLQSAWIVCFVTSLAGGRPGMVSGTTGAVAVVLTGLVHKFGIGHMFYAVMLAGLIQMLFGLLRLR